MRQGGAEACRVLAGVHTSEPIVYGSVLCEFEAPFDRNEMMYLRQNAGHAYTNKPVGGGGGAVESG